MSEWIVCSRNSGIDPRSAKPIRMVDIGDDKKSMDRFSDYLTKRNEVAYKRSSYGQYFGKQCKLAQLPKAVL